MNLPKGLLLAALAATFTLVSGSVQATTSAGVGDTGGDYSSAWFITPLPNAVYEGAPVSIDAEIGVYQGLDDEISTIELFVDGASVGVQPCTNTCIFPGIVLEQGVHEFMLAAQTNGYTTGLLVYVDEELPMPSDTGSETGGDSGSDSGSDGGSDGSGIGGEGADGVSSGADDGDGGGLNGRDGNGCSVQDGPLSPWSLLMLPMLLLVPGFRRRQG